MKTLMTGAGLALTLALTGCGDGNEPDELTDIEVPSGEVYQNRLQTMDEDARNATFIRALRDAGQPCQHVESSSFQGDRNGVPTWSATCDDSGEWLIMIGNDGVAQVISSQAAEQANMPVAAESDNEATPTQ